MISLMVIGRGISTYEGVGYTVSDHERVGKLSLVSSTAESRC